jgi:hypothetical protein
MGCLEPSDCKAVSLFVIPRGIVFAGVLGCFRWRVQLSVNSKKRGIMTDTTMQRMARKHF